MVKRVRQQTVIYVEGLTKTIKETSVRQLVYGPKNRTYDTTNTNNSKATFSIIST